RIPYLQLTGVAGLAVPTPGDDAFAIRAKAHARKPLGVPLEGKGFLPCLGIPDPHCFVKAPRGDAPAVRAKGHVGDPRSVPLEVEETLSRLHVPQTHRPVFHIRQHNSIAVGAEADAGNSFGVPPESKLLPSRLRI